MTDRLTDEQWAETLNAFARAAFDPHGNTGPTQQALARDRAAILAELERVTQAADDVGRALSATTNEKNRLNGLVDRLLGERNAEREQVTSQEAVIRDYEAWIEDACEALGVKTVFEFKAAGEKRERLHGLGDAIRRRPHSR